MAGKSNAEDASLHQQYNTWSEKHRAYIVARPVVFEGTHTLLDRLLEGSDEKLSLVEFPGVLLPAFRPTLEALQSMSETLDVAFADILAPTSTPANPDRNITVQPPTYATRPGFSFNLAAVTTSGTALRYIPGVKAEETIAQLQMHSTLDLGQAEAVVSSLSRSLALIQGPPGTGKS